MHIVFFHIILIQARNMDIKNMLNHDNSVLEHVNNIYTDLFE